jgi:hypothetical protein
MVHIGVLNFYKFLIDGGSKMSRLKKIKEREDVVRSIYKTAGSHMYLSSFILKSGDVIGISARMVNWKPWYQKFSKCHIWHAEK